MPLRVPLTLDELNDLTGQAERLFSPILAAATQGEPPSEDLPDRSPLVLFLPAAGGQQTVIGAVVLGMLLPLLSAPDPPPPQARDRSTVLVDL